MTEQLAIAILVVVFRVVMGIGAFGCMAAIVKILRDAVTQWVWLEGYEKFAGAMLIFLFACGFVLCSMTAILFVSLEG